MIVRAREVLLDMVGTTSLFGQIMGIGQCPIYGEGDARHYVKFPIMDIKEGKEKECVPISWLNFIPFNGLRHIFKIKAVQKVTLHFDFRTAVSLFLFILQSCFQCVSQTVSKAFIIIGVFFQKLALFPFGDCLFPIFGFFHKVAWTALEIHSRLPLMDFHFLMALRTAAIGQFRIFPFTEITLSV